MIKRSNSHKFTLFSLFCFLSFSLFDANSGAATTCSGVTSIVGQEYVAECLGGSTYRYVITDINCVNNLVIKGDQQYWFEGGSSYSPDYVQSAVINRATFSSSKVFGNSAKTHFVIVSDTFAKYGGYINGVAMKPLAYAPTLHVDVFDHIFVVPTNPPFDLDKDNDGYEVCKDCDDNEPTVNPGAVEVCADGKDNNCNGQTDCADVACTGQPVCCTDADGDGFSADGGSCGQVDCNDADPATHPGAVEACDGKDNNCDGQIDEGLSTDADGDGHFASGSCSQPADDCNDTNASIFPGGPIDCNIPPLAFPRDNCTNVSK